MHIRIIVLLAVCANFAATGPLRHNGARVQPHNFARFLNHTEIPSIPADIQTSTPIPISSSSIVPSIAASPETSAFVVTSSTKSIATPLTPNVASSSSPTTDALTVDALSQVLSTSATLPSTSSTTSPSEHSDVGSGATPVSTSALVDGGKLNSETHEAAAVQPAETMSRLFNIGGNPPNDVQSSTDALSFSSTPSPKLSASTSTIPDVQSTANMRTVAAMPSSSSTAIQAPFPSEAPLPTFSTAAASQVKSSSTTSIPTSSTAAASQAPSPVVVPIPISSGLVQVSGPGGDAADEFAPVTLDQSSPAPTGTAKYPAAEGGNTAMAAGFNNVYKTLNEDTPCNPGDPSQAYACVDGEIAECQSDETYVLKSCPQGQSCYALPKPSGLSGVVVQCAVPSDAYSMLAGLSSSTAVPLAVTSQPAPMLQAEGDFSQATQSVRAQNPVQPVTSSPPAQASIQSQSQAPNPSVLGVTATAQPVQDSDSLNTSPKSEATPAPPSTTAAVVSIPQALFAVVTAPENGQVSPSESSAQASIPTSQMSQPYPGVSTPAVQSSAMSTQASPDSLQLTEASVTSTSTSSADSAGITSAPMAVPANEKLAVGNGQATVTVTVTVTTTEKSSPVTISAS